MNQTTLTATVIESKPLRHTPAGVPVVEMVLEHESEQLEAGIQRRIEFSLAALALGDVALMLADASPGVRLETQGFLAASRKGSRRLVYHLQSARRLDPGSDPTVA